MEARLALLSCHRATDGLDQAIARPEMRLDMVLLSEQEKPRVRYLRRGSFRQRNEIGIPCTQED